MDISTGDAPATGAEAPNTDGGVSGDSGAANPDPNAEAAAAAGNGAAAFTPNFGFKYRGADKSDAEGQFDDIFKPLIKDADTEKKVRELYEKAHGLDFVKQDRDTLKQTHGELNQNYESQSAALRTLGQFVKNKDFDSFFEALKIPNHDILNFALQLVQREKMSPEQRAQFDAQRAEQQRVVALQMQNAELTQQFQNLAVQTRESELDGTLRHPQIAGMISDFDQRAGRPGAFRDLVVQKGQHHFFTSGIDVPVGQVVGEVIQLLGLQPGQAAGNAAQPAPGGVQRGSQGKPVLPNVPGKGGSPAKSVPRSTDDLRKLGRSMAAN